MSEIKRGYRGVCADHGEALAALYVSDDPIYSFKEISNIIAVNFGVRIRPESISKFIKRNFHLVRDAEEAKAKVDRLTGPKGPDGIQPLLGVVKPGGGFDYTSSSISGGGLMIDGKTGSISIEGELTLRQPEETTEDTDRQILIDLGHNPDEYYIHAFKAWGREDALNKSYDVRRKPSGELIMPDHEPDLPLLFAEASKGMRMRVPGPGVVNQIANVIVWADPQTGKVDKQGGVAEQRERIENIMSQALEYVDENPAEKGLFLDAGDGVEGFENTAQQMFTNDLSLMDQIDLEATYEQAFIEMLADSHEAVEVYGVDSNHARWRNGKNNLGQPKDDWGRFIKRQLRKAFAMSPNMDHVSFNEPDDWERTLNIDLWGRGIGLAHGDQSNGIDGLPKWWAGQTHGGLPVGDSELLITGHFHHFLLRQTGRHRNGTQKYHLGAPTLDNGSSWHEATSGESSDPGLIIFQFDKQNGFNFDSLTFLKEQK